MADAITLIVDIIQNARHNVESLDVKQNRDGTDGQDGRTGWTNRISKS